jgi:SMC interacting uncharacterized protein involved in chromosome segregation
MKSSRDRDELWELLQKLPEDLSDEVLLDLNQERGWIFQELGKLRAEANRLSSQVTSYNRILDKHEKRLTKLLTNGEGW